MNYRKGSAAISVLVVGVLLILVAGFVYHYASPAPVPGANAGPESSNEYFCNAGVCTWYKTVTCNTASSTMFAIPNPFAATSTASLTIIGTGQATSTTFSVGTTTKSSGLALADISPTLVNNGLVSTTTANTQFIAVSGVTGPTGSGQISAGATTLTRVVVGPNEKIGGFATSTYGTVGALNYSPSFTACRVVAEFKR